MTQPIALVTGAGGWLGTGLVRALAEGLPDVPRFKDAAGRRVRALLLPGQDEADLRAIRGNVEIVHGDVTDSTSLAPFLADVDGATLFHSAGIIHPSKVCQFFKVNVEGTRNVLAAAKQAGVKRLVHVSSNSPLGGNPTNEHVFDESAPYHPYMNYGKSKKLAEDFVNAASSNGIETVIIRPPWFYGPGQPPRQTRFFQMIKDGKAPLVGSGANRRSMAYVDNICQGAMLAESVQEARGKTYWIADARPYPMTEIIDTIESVLEEDFGISCRKRRLRLPGIASGVARIVDGTLQGVGLYNQEFHVLSEMNMTIACTVERARKELGYDPKIELREGMRRSIEWMFGRGMRLT